MIDDRTDDRPNVKTIWKYVHGSSDELSELWDYEAPQQDTFHYCLYEEDVEVEVDLDTGQWRYVSFAGVDLEHPTDWFPVRR